MDTQMLERAALPDSSRQPPLCPAVVALTVRDLDRVAAFYRDVVGLAVISRGDGEVCLGAGGVGLIQLLHQPAALPDDPASAGLFHTAILLPSRADLGRWLQHADTIGLRLDGAADHLVSEAVYLSDPEGNGIEIYADRPAGTWRWDGLADARQIEMANKPLDFHGLIAAANTPWQGAPDATRIGHVHLRVGDLAEAVAFYRGVLGLGVTRMLAEAAFLSTGGYHHHIATNIWRSPAAGPRDPARAGLAWVTMAAADEAVASAIAGRAAAANLCSADLRDPWGTRIKIINTSR